MKQKIETFEYKGYEGSIDFDFESRCLTGEVLFVRDSVFYVASTLDELEREFRCAVDQYLDDCADLGKDPDKPFSGSFNVRPGPDLHRKMAIAAKKIGATLNKAVINAFEHYIDFLNQKAPNLNVAITVNHNHRHHHDHIFRASHTQTIPVEDVASEADGWIIKSYAPFTRIAAR